MIDVHTEIEPPGLDDDDGDDDTSAVHLNASLMETDGTGRTAWTHLHGEDFTDDQLADGLIACLRGVATMRGPGLVAAVERRLA